MKRFVSPELFILLAVLFGVSPLVPPVSAAMISYEVFVPSRTADLQNVALPFPDFRRSLGTLTEVDLSLSPTVDTSITLWTTGKSGTATLKALTSFSLSVTDSRGFIANAPQISDISLLPANGTGKDAGYFVWSGPITGGTPVTIGPYVTGASCIYSYTNSSLLASLTGSGTTPLFSVSTATDSSISIRVNSFGGMTQTTNAALDATITYKYTAVPIPGGILLMAPGLVGLAGLRRRYSGGLEG